MTIFKKGQSFRFKEEFIQRGYPSDSLYYVGSFISENKERFIVLDGAGEDVLLAKESDIVPLEEDSQQKMLNVLVDLSQTMKMISHRLSEPAQHDHEFEPGDELEDEEKPAAPKRKPSDYN